MSALLRAEIEQLRARCNTLTNSAMINGSISKQRKQEIKRLLAALRIARLWMPIQPIDDGEKCEVAIVDKVLDLHKSDMETK